MLADPVQAHIALMEALPKNNEKIMSLAAYANWQALSVNALATAKNTLEAEEAIRPLIPEPQPQYPAGGLGQPLGP